MAAGADGARRERLERIAQRAETVSALLGYGPPTGELAGLASLLDGALHPTPDHALANACTRLRQTLSSCYCKSLDPPQAVGPACERFADHCHGIAMLLAIEGLLEAHDPEGWPALLHALPQTDRQSWREQVRGLLAPWPWAEEVLEEWDEVEALATLRSGCEYHRDEGSGIGEPDDGREVAEL